jgi:hypothetical protein
VRIKNFDSGAIVAPETLAISSGAASTTLRFNSYDCTLPVGRMYAHTAFYRYPKKSPGGSPYGGAGPQITHNPATSASRRAGRASRSTPTCTATRVTPKKAFCREGIKCGEEYLVSG